MTSSSPPPGPPARRSAASPAGAPLSSLYQELILDHYRRPRNRGGLEQPSVRVTLHNPVCGDEIDLQLAIAADRVGSIRFAGHGCSISQASASMMTQQAGGRTLPEIRELIDLFTELMHGSAPAAADRRLGDLRALQGVARFPVRIKCALLPWDALAEALRTHEAGSPDGGKIAVLDPEGLPEGEDRDLPL
ncbi:MAG: SUF system NifU family Fe-S cluster assembly protein [Gemmatimonadetes bacterium]|nr:SUF system NifU family Fe-S cluster assembly protein [Gemmatimonadota bacterium]